MRSTLVLDDELFKRAKQRALDLGVTLSELVNDALRESLAPRASAPTSPFVLPTFGDPRQVVHRTPKDLSAAIADDDLASLSAKR